MNNAKMWLVVSPTVGVPIFLGAVAVGSFAVHLQVVKNTTWVADFLQGKEMGSGAEMASAEMLDETDMQAAQASYVMQTDGGMEVTIIMPDGSTAVGILQSPEIHASAEAAELPALITQ